MAESLKDGSKRRKIVAWVVVVLMLLPLLAMQITDQVVWGVLDFVIFGVMLLCVGVGYELAARMTGNIAYRFAAGIALVTAFILVWVSGAVGIIGDEDYKANLMFVGVLAIGIIGASIARFQPRGMARALFATALAQVLIAVIVLTAGLGSASQNWPLDVLVFTGFFTLLWLLSAWLFKGAYD